MSSGVERVVGARDWNVSMAFIGRTYLWLKARRRSKGRWQVGSLALAEPTLAVDAAAGGILGERVRDARASGYTGVRVSIGEWLVRVNRSAVRWKALRVCSRARLNSVREEALWPSGCTSSFGDERRVSARRHGASEVGVARERLLQPKGAGGRRSKTSLRATFGEPS